jgi:DeoR/GlpR family transcriptional regulator of sugar metabolism
MLERIQREGGLSVAELARAYSVSAITVHRDLEQLAAEGLVERVHGGARALVPPAAELAAPAIATAWSQRVGQAGDAKEVIAARAAELVTPGSTVFLDSSSSALVLARRLMDDPPNELTLVTSSPAIAYEMQAEPVHVVVAPGELDQHMKMLAGRWTVEFLSQLNFDVAFVSCAGVTLEEGLTTARRPPPRRPLADVIAAARAGAQRTIALIDSTKFGRQSLLTIMGADEPDLIITDPALEPDVASAYVAAGVALEILSTKEAA